MNTSTSHPLALGTTPPRGTILALLRGRGMSQSYERNASASDSRPVRIEPVPIVVDPQPTTVVPLMPSAAVARGPSYRIRLVPHIDSRRSLKFDPITRDLKEGEPALRIGRATAHSNAHQSIPQPHPTTGKVAFKSKVVSRAHAELWVESGQFFVRDTRSSSGTFLNRARLSAANEESPAKQVKDGDILQLGVDYQGGTEDIYKSVKMRVEVGREWQDGRNAFNMSAMKNLKSLSSALPKVGKSSIPDCCICLYAVTIHQALFIAPCSHTFHYKCLRPILEQHHPAFTCPLCRTFADLEDDVEIEPEDDDDEQEAEEASLGDKLYGAETEVEMDRARLWNAVNQAAEPLEEEDAMEDAMMPGSCMNDVQQVKYSPT